MPRTLRAWSAIKVDIRLLLREDTDDESYWDDDLLLQLWNECMDLRFMQLCDQHEGWGTVRSAVNIVAGTRNYTLPEGMGRPRRILLSQNNVEIPLIRDDKHGVSTYTASIPYSGGVVPSARLVGSDLYLDPTPGSNITNGLIYEHDSTPTRFSADGDSLNDVWPAAPAEIESLLILDTAVACFEVEDAQGEAQTPVQWVSSIERRRARYEAAFFEFTATRFFAPQRSRGLDLGD